MLVCCVSGYHIVLNKQLNNDGCCAVRVSHFYEVEQPFGTTACMLLAANNRENLWRLNNVDFKDFNITKSYILLGQQQHKKLPVLLLLTNTTTITTTITITSIITTIIIIIIINSSLL